MSWAEVGAINPTGNWAGFLLPLQSRLLRLSFQSEDMLLETFQPRAFLRLRIADEGYSEKWETIWPKLGTMEIVELTPILIASNYLQVRRRRNPYSLQAEYTILIEQSTSDYYLIKFPTEPILFNGSPLTIDGVRVLN